MPTVIDSLIVTLGLDPSGYKRGQKEATAAVKHTKDEAARAAKEMESRGKQAAQFFGSIKNASLQLFAVLTGYGLKEFIEHTMTSTAATGRLAYNINVASGDLKAFTNMVQRNGGSADAAAASYKSLADAIEEYRVTGQASGNFLTALGMVGANGSESPLQILKLFNRFAQGKNPVYANMIGRWLGLDQGSINTALKSVADFNADLEKSYKLGVQTQRDVEAAKRLQQAWEGVGQQISNLGLEVETQWTPAVAGLLENLSKWIERNRTISHTTAEIGAALATIFALKPALWFLKWLGLAALRTVAKSPLLAGGALLMHSGELNKGEDAEVARLHAMARKGAPGSVLSLVRKLEGSADDAVSPAGAVGRYQIMPDTARRYGFDPSRLKDPAYNTQVATAILKDLTQRYGGNLDQILANYNASPRATAKFMKTGDAATLPKETQAYLAHAHRLINGSVKNETHVGTVNVYTKATDAAGIARDLKRELQKQSDGDSNLGLVTQSNAGLN